MFNYTPDAGSSFPVTSLKPLYTEKKKYTTVLASTSTYDETVTTDHYLCADIERTYDRSMFILTFHVNALSKYRDGRTLKEKKNVRSTSLSNISSVLWMDEIQQSMGSARFSVYDDDFFSEEIKTEERNTMALVIAGGMAPIVNNIPLPMKHGVFVLRLVYDERVGWALHTTDDMAFYPTQIREFIEDSELRDGEEESEEAYTDEITNIYHDLIKGEGTYENALARIVRLHAIYLYVNRDYIDVSISRENIQNRLLFRCLGNKLLISKKWSIVVWVSFKSSGELHVYLRLYSSLSPRKFISYRKKKFNQNNKNQELFDGDGKQEEHDVSKLPFYVYDSYGYAKSVRTMLIDTVEKDRVLMVGTGEFQKVMIVPELKSDNRHVRVAFRYSYIRMDWLDITNFTKETTQELGSMGIFSFLVPRFSFFYNDLLVSFYVEERADLGTVVNAVVLSSVQTAANSLKKGLIRYEFRIKTLLNITRGAYYEKEDRQYNIIPYYELPSRFFDVMPGYTNEDRAKIWRLFEDNAPFSLNSESVTQQLDRIDNKKLMDNVLNFIYQYTDQQSVAPSLDIRAPRNIVHFLPTDTDKLKTVTSQGKYEHTDSALVFSVMRSRPNYGDARDLQTFRNEGQCSVLPINPLFPSTFFFVGRESHQAKQRVITKYFSGYVSFIFYATEIGPVSMKQEWIMNILSHTHKYVRGGHYQFFVPNEPQEAEMINYDSINYIAPPTNPPRRMNNIPMDNLNRLIQAREMEEEEEDDEDNSIFTVDVDADIDFI